MIMKKVLVVLLSCILIIGMASVVLGAAQNGFAYKGENGQAPEGFGPEEGDSVPVGQTVSERVRMQVNAPGKEGECPPFGANEEGAEEGMPQQHGLTGVEFGQMIRTMAQSEPGAVARYMHQWRFCYPTLE
jgi:hypothetical protein